MSPPFALSVCIFFILWLFARDRKFRPMPSVGLWVALVWIAIVGSRPVSFWFDGGLLIEKPSDYISGSPLDRNVFLLLIFLGSVVLLKRGVKFGSIFAANRWVFIFFLYCGISIMWSDYPFVSLKRWIKDIGNIVMVLIIFSEKDPVQATKAIFSRYTYLAIPLSIVLIKYFPEFGRYYYSFTWLPGYSGVATEKNALGAIVFICGLFLIWDLIEKRSEIGKKTDRADLLIRVVLLLMVFWLIDKSESMTALLCLILGAGILYFMRHSGAKIVIRHLGKFSLVLALFILFLYSTPILFEIFAGVVERDITLTGRTDLWEDLLSEPINPLLGTGYQSFWLGPHVQRYWDKYYFRPNQAHNGYLEIYLNGGLLGLFFLIAMIVSVARKIRKKLLIGNSFETLRFSFLVVTLLYNWTEAMFNKLALVWIILLVASLNYPHSSIYIPKRAVQGIRDNLFETSSSLNS